MTNTQYDQFSDAYAKMCETDPVKKYVQYYNSLKLMGGLEDKFVLDLGCGNGTLLEPILAQNPRYVAALDSSEEQIAKIRQKHPSVHTYVCDMAEIPKEIKFDIINTTLALHYANDADHLSKIFQNAHQALVNGGIFVGVTYNPGFKRLNQDNYNRLFRKTQTGMSVEFTSIGKIANYSNPHIPDYEKAAKDFEFRWVPTIINADGLRKMPDFFKGFEEDCPYISFEARKQ